MYYVNWTLTNAQLELLAADCSVVDYNYDKKKPKKGEFDNTKADKKAIKKAADEWIDKYGDGADAGKGLAVNDILGEFKCDVGVKLE